jgi:streptomycin 3"-adenylyltransferase
VNGAAAAADALAADGLALANEVVRQVREVLGEAVVGAYLHGSAVLGGLRPTSDVDVLVVIGRPTRVRERRAIVDRLLEISGRRARRGPARPVELTIVLDTEVRPWRYPPRADFQYGEWLRDEYEAGRTPSPEASPDLAPLITMALAGNRPLFGPPPAEVLDPVPPRDLRRAIVASVPNLLADLESDTRNVLLTLARIWSTLATGDIRTKDQAAEWALARSPDRLRGVLNRAREMYLGGWDEEDWGALMPTVHELADRLVTEIEGVDGA